MTAEPDPTGEAGGKLSEHVALMVTVAAAIAEIAARLAAAAADADERAAAVLRAEQQAARGQARLAWAPIVDPHQHDSATLAQTGTAWAAAQPWRPDPEAEHATRMAEDRLRALRPDVMDHYDRLRRDGAADVDAMRQVAPDFDRPAARQQAAATDQTAVASVVPAGAAGREQAQHRHHAARTAAGLAGQAYPTRLQHATAPTTPPTGRPDTPTRPAAARRSR